MRTLIDQFVDAEAALQQVSNPSGTVSTGGLGEPKFNANEVRSPRSRIMILIDLR